MFIYYIFQYGKNVNFLEARDYSACSNLKIVQFNLFIATLLSIIIVTPTVAPEYTGTS